MFKKAIKESGALVKGKRLKLIGMFIIYVAVIMMTVGFYSPAILGFLGLPLAYGLYLYVMNMKKGTEKLEDLVAFYIDWKSGIKITLALLWYTLIVCVGLVLLVVPGIIWSYRYILMFYLLVENRDMGIEEAMKKSARLMKGHKFKYFCVAMVFMLIPMIIYLVGLEMITISAYKDFENNYVIDENLESMIALGGEEGLEEFPIDIDDEGPVLESEEDLYMPTATNYDSTIFTVVGFAIFMLGAILMIIVEPRTLAAQVVYYYALIENDQNKENA